MGRLAIRKRSVENGLVARDRSPRGNAERLSRTGRESLGPSGASSHGCVLSAHRELAERIGPSTLLAHRYVTFLRCKCVVPHAISWSNGPCESRLAQH